MGSEAVCSVRFNGQVSEGKALLETTELLFRGGDFRLKIPLRDITSLQDGDGALLVSFPAGSATFLLGNQAALWAEKIRNPRGLMEKLGVKAGLTVSVLGVQDAGFLDQLRSCCDDVVQDALRPGTDILFYEADSLADLGRLAELRATLKPTGAVWVVSPKGKGAPVKDVEIMAAAREAGLVDNKVASFSDTHTALRLVIPRARRQSP